MSITYTSIDDITADVTLITSKPKIKGNDDKLLQNTQDLENSKAEKTSPTISNPVFTGTVTAPKVVLTPEGGIAIKLTNKTGVSSVKGSVISSSTTTDNAFILQSNEFDAMGVVYENGIADGAECLVVVAGIAETLLKDGTASTRGYWVKCADTDGRADATNPLPTGGSFVAIDEHFKEIGHCLESKVAGTNVLAKIVLHFN